MPLRFTLRQLEYLVAVGDAGSIAAAADVVHVSAPSISAAIGQMEAEFGLALFVRRHAHGLVPTQAGRRLLDRARQVLAEAEGLNRLAGDLAGKVRGDLDLGCLLTFAQLVVPRLRKSFAERHPDVRIRQFELDQEAIFEGLRSGKLDVALTYDLHIADDLSFLPLADLPPYVLLGADHPLALQPSVTIGELALHPMVLLDLPFSNAYFLSMFRDAGVTPRIAERTRDMAVVRSLVANGFGWSLANMRPLNDHSPDGRPLRFLPVSGEVRALSLGLLTPAGAGNVMTVRAFCDHCRATITADAVPGITMR